MEIKVRIRTPEGMAGTGGKGIKYAILKKLLFRKAKIKKESINKDKTEILWVMDVHLRHWQGICRNVSVFRTLSKSILDNKQVTRALKKMADSPEDYQTVRDLIVDGTDIEIVKGTETEEFEKGDVR